jgi:hypothetical protein
MLVLMAEVYVFSAFEAKRVASSISPTTQPAPDPSHPSTSSAARYIRPQYLTAVHFMLMHFSLFVLLLPTL